MLMQPVCVFDGVSVWTEAHFCIRAAHLDSPLAYYGFTQQALLNPVPDYGICPRDSAVTHLHQIQHELRLRQPYVLKPDPSRQAPRTKPEVVAREPTTIVHRLGLIAVIYNGEHPGL